VVEAALDSEEDDDAAASGDVARLARSQGKTRLIGVALDHMVECLDEPHYLPGRLVVVVEAVGRGVLDDDVHARLRRPAEVESVLLREPRVQAFPVGPIGDVDVAIDDVAGAVS
jgi:hypothetical protein